MKTKKTKTMARSVCAGALLLCCVVPAYATASDPLSIVNNLSDFIFSIIKAIGMFCIAHYCFLCPVDFIHFSFKNEQVCSRKPAR